MRLNKRTNRLYARMLRAAKALTEAGKRREALAMRHAWGVWHRANQR